MLNRITGPTRFCVLAFGILAASMAHAGGCAPGGSNADCEKVAPAIKAGTSGCVTAPSGIGAVCGGAGADGGAAMRWVITSDKSALDDSVSVYVSLDSTTRIPAQYQSYTLPATLLLRCQEGSTAVLFGLGDHFMADIQSFGRIDYRIDDRKASHLSTLADTSNKFLGLWSGKRAIPFIKSLFDGSKLVARITPFNESPFEVTFDITGTKTAVADLRKACKW